MHVRFARFRAVALMVLWVGTVPAVAQITTGTVTGTIKDTTGGVIPGATVVLISEARGTRSVPAVTNATGDYVFPNTTADTYTVEVKLAGFRTLARGGVVVSAGERVSVPVLMIEPGDPRQVDQDEGQLEGIPRAVGRYVDGLFVRRLVPAFL